LERTRAGEPRKAPPDGQSFGADLGVDVVGLAAVGAALLEAAVLGKDGSQELAAALDVVGPELLELN
jgi:hypothetical protein